MPRIELFPHGWREELRALLLGVKDSFTIVSPYIRRREAEFVAANVGKNAGITTITHLSESSLLGGALEITALNILGGFSKNSEVINLPQLHAKIYVADKNRAIITSANLTTSGIEQNYEYGVGINSRSVVRKICGHIANYTEIGNHVAMNDLENISKKVDDAVRQIKISKSKEAKELHHAIRALDDECQRLYIGKNTPTSLFKKAICHMLRNAPMTTRELQDATRALYPGLCADNANRVINGHSFGKLWKHHLRNAQQGLKKSGKIEYDSSVQKWALSRNS